MKTTKKLLSVLLSVLMLLSAFAVAAGAEGTLAEALTEAQGWYSEIRSTYFGYNDGEALVSSLKTAIEDASALDVNADQADVNAAIAALQDATGSLVLAYGYNQAGFVSTIEDEYPEIAATLRDAIAAAEPVLSNLDATPAEKLATGKALLLAQHIAAFEVEKAGAIARLQNQLRPNDSEACQQIVSQAVAALTALTFDESKDYFANRDIVSGMENNASDALRAQQQADYDASITWAPVQTSDEGLSKGELYLDLDAYESGRAVIYGNMKLYDLIPANNAGAAGREALKKQYSELWIVAYGQSMAKNNLYVNMETGKIRIGDEEYLPEEYFAPENFGGIYLNDAENFFEALLAEERPDLFNTFPWGTQIDESKLEEIGIAYVQDFYAAEYAQAMAFGAQQAKEETDALRALDWYLNTTDYSSVKAMQNGEPYAFDGDPAILHEILNTLTEVGLEWTEVKLVENTEGLENGDYYMLKSTLAALGVPSDSLAVSVNADATDTSPYQYQLALDYGHGMKRTFAFPMNEGFGFPVDTAFFKENVKLYHPEHTFGEWTYADAANHSRTCSICGEVETEEHDVIIKGAGDATSSAEGYTGDEYCSVCGQKLSEGEIIPATGEDTPVVPETPTDSGETEETGKKPFVGDFLSKLFAWLVELFNMFTRWVKGAK